MLHLGQMRPLRLPFKRWKPRYSFTAFQSPTVSASSPVVTSSSARISARISSRGRRGCGL